MDDEFAALSSVRCDKAAWPIDKVVSTIREGRGSQFEPRLVDVMLENFDTMIEIRDRFPDKP
jgi:response regulator RpfG family c-di-GMP phosphodiesterase